MKIGLIGAGQIGSRHLQALAHLDRDAEIFMVDISNDARALSRDRFMAEQPPAGIELIDLEQLSQLPDVLDVGIIATGAAPRRAIIESLLESHKVSTLLLEKFLFQSIGDYAHVETLLAKKGVNAWVNFPRRQWPGYQSLRQHFAGGPIGAEIVLGRQVSLGSNACHFLDLATYLSGGKRTYEVVHNGLSMQSNVSRHEGSVEFFGTVVFKADDGSVVSLSAYEDNQAPHLITVHGNGARAVIDEFGQKALLSTEGGDWKPTPMDFAMPYQSRLTQLAVQDIVDGNPCDLPSFDESIPNHLACLGVFLQALNAARDTVTNICNIT